MSKKFKREGTNGQTKAQKKKTKLLEPQERKVVPAVGKKGGFCYERCDPETAMGRLWVECNELWIFLRALFALDDEEEHNMKEETTDPFAPLDDDDEYHSKGDSEATIARWKEKLAPREGRWTVHMKLLGISRVFYERKEAQIFIYETFRAYDPTVSLFNGSFLCVGDGQKGQDQKKKAKYDGSYAEDITLSVANTDGLELEQEALCVYFADAENWNEAEVPVGCGPLEGNKAVCNFEPLKQDKHQGWRGLFQHMWQALETMTWNELMSNTWHTPPGTNVVLLEDQKELEHLSNVFAACYESMMQKKAEECPAFKAALMATYPLCLIYMPRGGSARHAFLWEKVRNAWLGKPDVCKQKPVFLDGWYYSEPQDLDIVSPGDEPPFRGIVVLHPCLSVRTSGMTAKEIEDLSEKVPGWQDLVRGLVSREEAVLPECDLCTDSIEYYRNAPCVKKVTRASYIETVTKHALSHGRFGELEMLIHRRDWHEEFSRGICEDPTYKRERLLEKTLNEQLLRVMCMNQQGQLEFGEE